MPLAMYTGSFTCILGLLSCSGPLGNLFRVLIMLIKKYVRLGSDDEIPISCVGLHALILQKSPV